MFSKDKVKGFITGAVVASLLSATVAFAAPIEQVKTIFYSNIKIYIDGNQIQPKDAQGNLVEPFIMDGTTYLPVRAVANAFNKAVRWDGATSSVYLGKSDVASPTVWLNEIEYFNYQVSDNGCKFEQWNPENDKDNTGNTYLRGLKFTQYESYGDGNESSSQYIEYLLNQKYSKVSGKFVLHYDHRNDPGANSNSKMKIYGDDQLIYTSPVLKAGVLPINFDVNVTGVIKLKIQFENDKLDSGHSLRYGLVDVGLFE